MKKKILFLLEAFNKGGVEKVTLDIVNHLDPEKYDITVKSIWPGGHCQSLVSPHIKVESFFPGKYIKGGHILIKHLPGKILYRLFIREKYDIEIAASDGRCAKIISGSSNKKSKKVCWVHMDVIRNGSSLKEYKKQSSAQKIFKKFDIIAPVSEDCKLQFEKKFGDNYKFNIVRNPLNVQEIIEKAKITPDITFSNNRLNIICVGRIENEKGFDRLINVCNTIKENNKIINFHIYIIGSGSQEQILKDMVTKRNLNTIITFLGFKSNPYPYIKCADVFFLSSRNEAFPLVVGESLILGTPVIATKCSGVAEWLNNEKYGFLIDNSEEGIEQGLKKIINGSNILKEKKVNINKDFLKTISFERDLNNFEMLLQ